YMMASATLAPSDLSHAKRLLHMRTENLVMIKTSIDRFNIKLCVRKIKHTLASFQDLGFLIPDAWKNTDRSSARYCPDSLRLVTVLWLI
ncbi:hypothetical protein EV702DRAFT_979944, partial [Suillus placidus]